MRTHSASREMNVAADLQHEEQVGTPQLPHDEAALVYADMDVQAIVADYGQVAPKQTRKKPPPLHTQVAALVDRVEKQTSRTDRLFQLLTQKPTPVPPRPTPRRGSTEKVVENFSHNPHSDKPRAKRVSGAGVKRRSTKNGPGVNYNRARSNCTYADESIYGSSDSDIEAQVNAAMGMMEPKFRQYKGKGDYGTKDDKVKRNRPFYFLGREQQCMILKKGRPEELSFIQHISGLVAMAVESMDPNHDAYGIINHVAQILEDSGYVSWDTLRAFSNNVILNVAKGKWSWCSERAIESCRTNHYMRTRSYEEPAWSVPCPRYNRGRCDEDDTHIIAEVTMRHVCAYCATLGYENGHTLRSCHKRRNAMGSFQSSRGHSDERKDNRQGRNYGGRNDKFEDNRKN